MSSVSSVRAAMAWSVLDQADSLARTESDRELDLGAQILRRTLHQYIAAIVVAKLEHLRRDFRTAAVTFAKVVIHNDSHRIAPTSYACISEGLGRSRLEVQVSCLQTIDIPVALLQRVDFD